MLTPELEKLKRHLEGTENQIDKELLLQELHELDNDNTKPVLESLAQSVNICPSCGRPL